MFKGKITRRQLCIAGGVAVAGIGFAAFARYLRWTPERSFHSLAAARHIQGIEVIGFRSDVGKDSSYTWGLRHSAEAVPLILASLPFHQCDSADSDWLRQMFTADFQLPQQSLSDYTGYRGDNARNDAEYFLVAPDGRESFYCYIDF
jgi:hypothetical protein